jgi:hypothetical protein
MTTFQGNPNEIGLKTQITFIFCVTCQNWFVAMTRRYRPDVPVNIQQLINVNESHAAAVHQAKVNQALTNETRFREEHSGFMHNAEVRRNVRRSREESKLARLDLIIDRRAKLAELFAAERVDWDRRLQAQGRAVYRRPR